MIINLIEEYLIHNYYQFKEILQNVGELGSGKNQGSKFS